MELDLSGLSITDLATITFPTNGALANGTLNLANNDITALLPISSLPITKLILNNNKNLTSLVGMPSTVTYLEANNCDLSDLTGLAPNVTILLVANNRIADISAIPAGPMAICDLTANNLSSMQHMPSCGLLILNSNSITAFNALYPIQATTLELRHNPLADWSGFDAAVHLVSQVDITGTAIVDMTPPVADLILFNDKPASLNFETTNIVALQKNRRFARQQNLAVTMVHTSASLLPGLGIPADILSLNCTEWRRIGGVDGIGTQHAGVIRTSTDFTNSFYRFTDGASVTGGTNSLRYIGSGPVDFRCTINLSVLPAAGTLYVLAVRNQTANSMSVYDYISSGATFESMVQSGSVVVLSSTRSQVQGCGTLRLSTNDTITFYASYSRSMVVSVDTFYVSIVQTNAVKPEAVEFRFL